MNIHTYDVSYSVGGQKCIMSIDAPSETEVRRLFAKFLPDAKIANIVKNDSGE